MRNIMQSTYNSRQRSGRTMTAGDLLAALDRLRPEVAAHSRRVADLSWQLGLRAGLRSGHLAELEQAALLHDTGKLESPRHILEKPGLLMPSERAIVERHAGRSAELAHEAGLPPAIVRMVRQHHERLDGSGYPAALTADDIDAGGRILAVCDVYDALTSVRPYASAWPRHQALAYLTAHARRLFDIGYVVSLRELVDSASPLRQAA